MFELFTNTARRVIVLSAGEARTLKHMQIAPGHLLLGVATCEEATAGANLASLGVEAEALRQKVVAKYSRGENDLEGHIPFSDESKIALEQSLRESRAMDHTYIGTEHVMLGLTKDPAGDAAQLLIELGVQPETVRQAIMERLGSAGGSQPVEP